ncbi:hypothetical protein D3C72_2113170 [compost metagenome]
MANRVKITANDNEKPNITTTGVSKSVLIATSDVPINGPVQEKETTAKVAAMKKIPLRPFESDLASSLLTKELGSVISNAPKKETPKTINIRKMKILKNPSVEISFNALAPQISVIITPKPT